MPLSSGTSSNSNSTHGRSFTYLPEWQVLLCVSCGSCLPPTCSAQTRHLREPPHRLRGAELAQLIELFATYQLRPLPPPIESEGDSSRPATLRLPTKAVAGLRLRAGFACLLCAAFLSCDRKALQRHISKQHGQQRAVEQIEGASYQHCLLQTFFSETRHIRYFLVSNSGDSGDVHDGGGGALSIAEKAFLQATLSGQNEATRAAIARANTIVAFDMHKSEVIPWLRTTGIAEHLRGLRKDEIAAAIALPTSAEQATEPVLSLLLDILERVLREAHSWCFEGPQQRLTWPRQLALNCFHNESSASGKRRLSGFDPHKEAATLTTYFRYWKQFLCYHYRVVYRGGHFTRDEGVLQTPDSEIRIISCQQQAWDKVTQALEAKEPDLEALKLPVQRLSLSMLEVKHGTQRFSSSLVSFCTMLSVKPSTLAWKDAGNFNSFLSGLIWTTQLLIFHHCATEEMAGKGEGLDLIHSYCKRFLAQGAETPMGEVLRWRLLLFRVAKETVGLRQATWDEAEEVLTYGGVELRMGEVPKLILSEFRKAECYLYDELMLTAASALPRIHAWALRDDYDNSTVGWFFGRHPLNKALLDPQRKALLQRLFESQCLRDAFLDCISTAGTGVGSSAGEGTIVAGARESSAALQWRTKALAHYEAVVCEFLKRLIVLIHVTAGQPLREPELLSLTWFNTQKRRAITIKHGRVMLHTTYHKGQQQTGTFKDNIRFLPAAVGDLLLEYLVYIVPLREIFLRHLTPETAIAPFLWWKQGKVWPDSSLSKAMQLASVRAKIPCLKIANWRQMTVSIVKTKFAADLRYFDTVESHCQDDGEDN